LLRSRSPLRLQWPIPSPKIHFVSTGYLGAVDADLPAWCSFTTGLRRDLDAVVAGLTLKYNSGAVEGTVNRIEQLRAAIYGPAKPDLCASSYS
jgi:hypothetical protein